MKMYFIDRWTRFIISSYFITLYMIIITYNSHLTSNNISYDHSNIPLYYSKEKKEEKNKIDKNKIKRSRIYYNK